MLRAKACYNAETSRSLLIDISSLTCERLLLSFPAMALTEAAAVVPPSCRIATARDSQVALPSPLAISDMISSSLEEAFGVVGGSSVRFDVLQVVTAPTSASTASSGRPKVKGRGLLRTIASSNADLARDEVERLEKAISLTHASNWRLGIQSTSHGLAFEGLGMTSREWFEDMARDDDDR